MGFKIKLLILGVLIIVVTGSFVGVMMFKKQGLTKVKDIKNENIVTKEVSVSSLKDFNKYEAESNPRIPEYKLPLQKSEIVNFNDIKSIISISNSAESALFKNGFVVVPNTKFKDIVLGSEEDKSISSYFQKYYGYLHSQVEKASIYNDDWSIPPKTTKHLPMFISSDSVLHYFHLMFDTTLIKLETNVFYDYLWNISKSLLDKSVEDYNTAKDPIIKEAAKRNVAYFSVALKLLSPETQTSSIYDNPLYKEGAITPAMSGCSKCVDDLLKDEYDEIPKCLSTPFNYYDFIAYIIDGKVVVESESSYVPSHLEPEYNINKIIETCFKQEGLISKKDVAKMNEIKTCCEKKVTEELQEGNPMELVGKSDKYIFDTPDIVKNIVNKELDNISKHNGWSKSPLFIYQEDYSQYVPRAHYTKSEKLKKYFKAMMWYGRMTFLAQGDSAQKTGTSICSENGILSSYDAKIQTVGSVLINSYLLNDNVLQSKLTKMTEILDFLVGSSDDLGMKEYIKVMNKYVKNSGDIVKNIDLIQKDIINLPDKTKIYSGLGACQMDISNETQLNDQATGILKVTKGFRLFGQKFVPDSYWMSQIVSPYSGEYTGGSVKPFTWVKASTEKGARGFPRGLDVMSILGSKRADEIIKEIKDDTYTNYTKQMNLYKAEVKKFTVNDWYKTVYNSWLYSLTALLGNFVKGYPTFMLTKAYQDKSLTTALASWAQLRHDTLLYVKQSYTMAERGGGPQEPVIVGYVEPIPELYIRLFKTSLIFQDKLNKMIGNDKEYESIKESISFDLLNDILDKLIVISNKELRHEVLTEDEYDFIDGFADTSRSLITYLAADPNGGDIVDVGEIMNAMMVADVHTDGNTKQVLEEGVGKIRTGLFVYRAPQNNNLVLGMGPIFSYYEFKQDMSKRLTDEEWRKMLIETGKPANTLQWINSFYIYQ